MIKTGLRRALAHKYVGRAAGWLIRATHTADAVPEHVRRLMPETGAFSIRLPDGKWMRFNSLGPEESVAIRLYWEGFRGYESQTTSLFYRLCRERLCVLDVGAYTGYFTLLACLANPENRVVCFEPVPANCERLRDNLRINGVSNVTVESAAISDHDGQVELFLPSAPFPSSASTLNGFREAGSTIKVECIAVDTYARRNGLERIDLVKIDTEATEHKVLKGMQAVMERDSPLMISEVLHGRNEAEQQAILADYGYRWFWITDRGLIPTEDLRGDSEYRFPNYLYAHPRRQDLCRLLPSGARRVLGG
jgi:FkbM family methyltransferase